MDHEPVGPPETSVELPGDCTVGLWVPAPFGAGTDAQLAIRIVATATGAVWTAAITTLVIRAQPHAPRVGLGDEGIA